MTDQTPSYRCQKRPQDFFSYSQGQISNAKRACLGIPEAGQEPCPILDACRNYARINGEWGVWGGETEAERRAAGYPPRHKIISEVHSNAFDPVLNDPYRAPDIPADQFQPRPKRKSSRVLKPHGTDAAIRRHRKNHELLCDKCKIEDRRLGEAERRAKGMKAMQMADCGTRSAAQRHRRRGEEVCPPCKRADADWYRENNARKRREAAEKADQEAGLAVSGG